MTKNTRNQQSPTPPVSILKLLQIVEGDTSLESDLSQSWVIREFQAGEDLNGHTEDSSNFLYLICQGQVGLWAFDATLGQEVSTQLLLAEQTFGAEHLFFHQTLPYRAIATSAGCVAQIAIADLKQCLHSIPDLESDLQLFTYQQQALIFFKTHTQWRSLTSSTLEELLSYLVAMKITAGSSLQAATAPAQGRFWLAGGKIDNSQHIGDSWVYPDDTLTDGIAQTDVLVYHLSIEHWESVKALAPDLFPEPKAQQTNSQIIQIPLPLPQSTEDDPDTSEVEKIDFPQGGNQPKFRAKLWPNYPFIPQQSASDSGAACLAMISQYWGKRWGLYTLRNLAQIDRMGASLHGLAAAADNLGYDVQAVRASLDKLDTHTNPWIAHWQEIDYVVVWQVKSDRLLISDPAIGKRWLSLAEFAASWTGYALLLNPTQRFYTLKSKKISLRRYWNTLRNYRKLLGQILLASMLVQVIGLAIPLFTQVVIDQIIPLKDVDTLNIFALSFLCLGIWRTVLIAQRQYLLEYIANRIDIHLIGRFINYTLQLPLLFFASRPVEDMINRVEENSKIQLFLTRMAVSGTIDSLMVLIYLGLMANYNWQLTLLVLVWMLFIVIVSIVSSPFLKKASQEVFQESVAQNSAISEMFAGIVTVKTAAAEYSVQKHWEKLFQNMLQVRLRGRKLASNLQLIRSAINQLGSTVILWLGINLVISQQISLGKFVAFNLLVSHMAIAVLALVDLWDEFPEVQVAVERIEDVFASQPEANFHTPLPAIPAIRGEVHFDHVCFRYHPDEDGETLQNICFQVKPRQTIGIIGESGSGKSTLVNLLAGLYRPDTGRILIDGQDISLVSPQSLRSQLGFIPQECFLFSGTILENITLYNSEFSTEQAIAAAQRADAHSFIAALPLGYNTQVGETGVRLSGGQKQKIAIARALITNPAILILDEATNALDAESERRFQQNLVQMSEDITTFIISHRLSSVRHAHRILVLDKGVLIEQGTHQELIAQPGLYRHLAQLQLQL
ncbi:MULTISPECIES: cysteine peptidase family C39 domain-containing protein [unclassified Nodularia (in: cyanobacteria)]|uniref:cysteine peptidase family C39 domain-containing protein n=1 Tax=unclassified Nodularia (in: cyanobacteria) TaxID=2656917 RepID=UPI001882E1BF|nr:MULTISPECIES: cysteine peptidase family C39 domain-containing protein [unclassified Nodularia (in: cyanobacteria)]MBE9197941.1 ATP-binding cassette domain-containing protein [Nodularia sp. LEGE 06071]MCC2693558.1 ATP-binding cassette domain-containing protein [Nodularia sp. LEGE 04288]